MPKFLIQDIVVSKKQKPEQSVRKLFPGKLDEEAPKKIKEFPRMPRFKMPHFKIPHPGFFHPLKLFLKLKLIGGVAFIAILIFAGISLLNKFSSIVIEITPRQEFVEVDAILNAASKPQKDELEAEIMSITREEKGNVRPTGVKQVSRKASGQIVIYNTYSSDSQPLVKNTRFASPDGKIYRIESSITVPGTKVLEGKVVAGEIETTVFADKPGEEYNSDFADFVIPGFQDLVKREKIYARSETKIEGGFIGEAAVITENDIKMLQSSLREKIKDYLFGASGNPKPEEFLLYDDARQIIFEKKKDEPKAGDESDLLELAERGTLYGFLLKKEEIGRLLAKKYFGPETTPQIALINPEKLVFEMKNFTAENVSFQLKGSAHFSWRIDENEIKNVLLLERKNPDIVFQKYPAIEKARVIFKPSWWQIVPQKTEQISINKILKTEP